MKLLKLVLPVVFACVLSACTSKPGPTLKPGGYTNYREMFIAQMNAIDYPWSSDLAQKLNACATDVWFEHATPEELGPLDRYARGELELEEYEIRRLNVQVDERMGGPENQWRLTANKCPDVVKAVEPYRKK